MEWNGRERRPIEQSKMANEICDIQEHFRLENRQLVWQTWSLISIHFNSHRILKWVRIKTNERTNETTK